MTRREELHEERIERAVSKQAKIMAIEHITGAKTHRAVEALDENAWDVDLAINAILKR